MTIEVTKTKIDQLGDRLRRGKISDDDLRLLDQYRRSFSEAYESVVEKLRDDLSLEPTGRPEKSSTSIADKLRRESIRLTEMQDIAGCRLIVSNIAEQETVVRAITSLFENSIEIDRRIKPSHGYRAVHLIVNVEGKVIEIQVRTSLQHLWAELSEKLSDVVDREIKYGGGNDEIQQLLGRMSAFIFIGEFEEAVVFAIEARNWDEVRETQTRFPQLIKALGLTEPWKLTDAILKMKLDEIKNNYSVRREKWAKMLRDIIGLVETSGS